MVSRRSTVASARDAIRGIGTDEERLRTGADLMRALRATREADGRGL